MQKTINNIRCFNIFIEGIVQGVGFRPFVYNFAVSNGYKGSIKNTSCGVMIELECDDPCDFLSYIKDSCPPLALIHSINIEESNPKDFSDFSILESFDEGGFTHLSPDISVCSDCLSELLDSSDRRYLYPFINCTNCGPRYSIVKQVPYDRPNTTMSIFSMCDECMEEYQNPSDRRFHAQPNACHVCGPQLRLILDNAEIEGSTEDILQTSINLLKHGYILALKGLGGFHLVCDAENEDVVRKLRQRKRRINKPFAVMSLDVQTIKKYCEVSQAEAALLEDRRRPIVLLTKKRNFNLPNEISPNNKYLGCMLPYTPLHHLLFTYSGFMKEGRAAANFEALVMTSGNISEEPIAASNEDALLRLAGIADAFLVHDRDIFTRVDDSVLKIHDNKLVFIRRARGYVPESVELTGGSFDIIASGADIKNTFTIVKGDKAVISQHTGDLENIETIEFFQETLDNLKSVYRASPAAIAHDLHPSYHSVKWALNYSDKSMIKSYSVQHHYAHIASVMAEKNLTDRLIGIAFDGTGYGTDGNLWGGEFLLCDLEGFKRFAHFGYIPLPGGEMAIKECWRTAISYLWRAMPEIFIKSYRRKEFIDMLDSIGFIQKYGIKKIDNVLKIMDNRHFSPLSSGAGRLFDAVSALTGICDVNTYEGESAAALENILDEQEVIQTVSYPFEIKNADPCSVDFSPMIMSILNDIRNADNVGLISHRFHNTLVDVIRAVANIIRHETGINSVALSGGVFQNKYITENASQALLRNGYDVFFNEKVPCNDAGISLGQAYILNHKLKRE